VSQITPFELTRVEKGAQFSLVVTITQGLLAALAITWLLSHVPEPFTLRPSPVTAVLVFAAVTLLYCAVTFSLLEGTTVESYEWQLSAIFGIVFGSLFFAFVLESPDELLDIPLYQGLDEEFTRRFNFPLLPGEDDDWAAFDRRLLVTRVILALLTGLLSSCHFYASLRRAVYHHRLVSSEFHGKFFKYALA
jgi:hypothetical protein